MKLPLKGNPALLYASTIIIAILMAVAAGSGLLWSETIYPTSELLQSFLPTDVSLVFIGLPMLLVSMWLTWRGKLIGLLFWPGAVFFVLYNYIVYVLAMPLTAAYLLYLAVIPLSVYTLINLLASIDQREVKGRLEGAVSERLAGGVLAGLGFLFFLRAIYIIVSALTRQTLITETELAANSTDFIIAPAWVIGGMLLWRHQALGYTTGLGLLFQGSMLFIGLIIVLLLQPILADMPIGFVDVVVVFIMGLICFIPCGLFIRGVTRGALSSL